MQISWTAVIAALIVALMVSGCQTPTPAQSSCRYPERDLTVSWQQRQYWCWPLEGQPVTVLAQTTPSEEAFSVQEER